MKKKIIGKTILSLLTLAVVAIGLFVIIKTDVDTTDENSVISTAKTNKVVAQDNLASESNIFANTIKSNKTLDEGGSSNDKQGEMQLVYEKQVEEIIVQLIKDFDLKTPPTYKELDAIFRAKAKKGAAIAKYEEALKYVNQDKVDDLLQEIYDYNLKKINILLSKKYGSKTDVEEINNAIRQESLGNDLTTREFEFSQNAVGGNKTILEIIAFRICLDRCGEMLNTYKYKQES